MMRGLLCWKLDVGEVDPDKRRVEYGATLPKLAKALPKDKDLLQE